jgi:hypothetical protein
MMLQSDPSSGKKKKKKKGNGEKAGESKGDVVQAIEQGPSHPSRVALAPL